MRKLFIAGAAVLSIVGSASASDLTEDELMIRGAVNLTAAQAFCNAEITKDGHAAISYVKMFFSEEAIDAQMEAVAKIIDKLGKSEWCALSPKHYRKIGLLN